MSETNKRYFAPPIFFACIRKVSIVLNRHIYRAGKHLWPAASSQKLVACSSHLLNLLQAFLNFCFLLVGYIRMRRTLIALFAAHQSAESVFHWAKATDARRPQQLLGVSKVGKWRINVFAGPLGG